MAPGVSFSTASLEFLVDDGTTDATDATTEPDDYSSVSSDDMHIGLSSRPQLPLILSHGSVSKSLPSTLPSGIVSRRTGPPPRSQSTRPHPTSDHQRPSTYSPRPQLYHPPPPHTPLRPRAPPPPPPPPPPPRPPSLPSFTPPATQTLLRPLDQRDISSSHLAAPHHGHNARGHGDDRESFFSSSEESDTTGFDANGEPDSFQHLTENYLELRNERSALSMVFDTAKSHQAQVRSMRRNEAEASRKFMAMVQTSLPAEQCHQLHQLFKVMQDSQQARQKAEERFDQTINELYRGQDNLGSHEEIFYNTITRTLGIALFNNINNDRDDHSENSDDWALRGITGDRPETFHPLYEKLRVAFGELQLARELLTNTQMKRDRLHARKAQIFTEDSLDVLETYGDVGKKKAHELRAMVHMTEEDNEQLREYDELERDAKQDIEIYTEKMIILQRECRENGVLPQSSYFQQEGFGVDSSYRDEIRLVPGSFDSNDETATLAHPVFPHILSNPTHLLHGFPQTALQSLKMAIQLPLDAPVRAKKIKEAAREANMHTLLSNVKSENKSDYINGWLLHKLHHSALEAELLWTTFRSRLTILDIDRWQGDVIKFWWLDNSVDPVSVNIGNNHTDKASVFAGSCREINKFPHSDSGQLDGLRTWNLDDSWP
ncbi:hypothetical protein F5B22DRAFT_186261 [Xylaria bambusicola]|uniref:uncharacterized protein n=1 Tax=Xylaria bambusicola TaxID=326684 RepID=UPI00200811C9|nr:uncharacterized protein F5B22DRAFT_186261 [Xylaria bambusicola]KAI0515380.1 hypothetical protein F5B22DRAFT_186261 [Xylaria bambusicola]